MRKLSDDRLDPSLLTQEERASLERLSEAVRSKERPALIGREGIHIPLPDPIFHFLVGVLRTIRAGKAVVVLPENEGFTTQAAADFLGVSRPFLVGLLDGGKIPHYKVGKHRRIYLKDLIAYRKTRDQERRRILDELTESLDKAGVYDKVEPASEL